LFPSSGRSRARKGRDPAPDLHLYTGELAPHENDGTHTRLITTAKSVGTKLIVIDTMSRSMSGADENSPQDMTGKVSTIGKVIRETGAHVMMVHRTDKDEGKASRGHSSLKAATDVEDEISRVPAGGRVLRLTKVKDGRSPKRWRDRHSMASQCPAK